MRLIGVDNGGFQRILDPSYQVTVPTLKGALAVNGNLTIKAAQIYPTTGSTFAITSAAANGTIAIGRSGTDTPPVPYTAGGNLSIQAANILQGGVIRVPFGTLTLGSNTPKLSEAAFNPEQIAPATQTLLLDDGSITSVSAGGLSISLRHDHRHDRMVFRADNDIQARRPADQGVHAERQGHHAGAWRHCRSFPAAVTFTPMSSYRAPAARAMCSASSTATSTAPTRSTALVTNTRTAAKSTPSCRASPTLRSRSTTRSIPQLRKPDVRFRRRRRVWLDGGNGLAAGWYTLLPAQYALLPGGMRVVEQSGAKNVIPGTSFKLTDGSLLVSGRYGDALSGASDYQVRQFSVMSQDVIRSYSNIALTSGNNFVLSQAAAQGAVAARNGLDAGRLVLNPLGSLTVNALVIGTPALDEKGNAIGRGSQVDIGGNRIVITSTAADARQPVPSISPQRASTISTRKAC